MSNTTITTPDTSTPGPGPTTLTTSTTPPPPPTTSTTSPTVTPTTKPPVSTTSTPSPPATSTPPPLVTTTAIVTTDGGGKTITMVQTVTTGVPGQTFNTDTVPTGSATSAGSAINPTNTASGGLDDKGKIAIAVVVPIVAVVLLVCAGLWLWRRRKQQKDAEEQRRKEVEEYGYNPNADPTIPAVAGAAAGPYEMKEDATSGYRGWGSTTLAGSTGRKASTTLSGGGGGIAYSDATSPTRGGVSDTRSGEPLVNDRNTETPDAEILGAMGPSAANNRADVRRGPSNASSSYSGVARSDGSGDAPIGVAYGGSAYDQYGGGNPYVDGSYGNRQGPPELGGSPVIRDVTARRNTRIENTAHYPQQSAGISQNF